VYKFDVLYIYNNKKALPRAERRHLTYIKRKIGLTDSPDRVEEPKKRSSLNFEQEGCIFHLCGEQKPLGASSPIFWWLGSTS